MKIVRCAFVLTLLSTVAAQLLAGDFYPDEIYTPGFSTSASDGFDKTRCTYNGIPLYGKVRVVSAHGDFDVKIVDSFPDLKVKTVSQFPDECGKWKFVDHHADFSIRYVTSHPDLKIKMVDHFPGVY